MCVWAKQWLLRPQALTQRSKGGWSGRLPGRGGEQADRLVLRALSSFNGLPGAEGIAGKGGSGQGRPHPVLSRGPLCRCQGARQPPFHRAWQTNSFRGVGIWVPILPTARPKWIRVSLCFCDGHSPGHRVGGGGGTICPTHIHLSLFRPVPHGFLVPGP